MNWLDEGKQPREIYEDCPECGGTGYVDELMTDVDCPGCGGLGYIEKRSIDRGDDERDNKEYFNNLNKE